MDKKLYKSIIHGIRYGKLAVIHFILWNFIGLSLYASYYFDSSDLRVLMFLIAVIAILLLYQLRYRYPIIGSTLLVLFILLDWYDSQVIFHSMVLANTTGCFFRWDILLSRVELCCQEGLDMMGMLKP